MRNLTFLLLTALILLLSSCNNPLNKTYSEKSYEKDKQMLKESKKLKKEELETLDYYISEAKDYTDTLIEGMTYSELLIKAKDAEAKQNAINASIKKESEERMQKMDSTLNVTLTSTGFVEQDYEDFLFYVLSFENKSNKDIKAIKGILVINDLFGKEIKDMNIVFDKGVKSRESKKMTYNYRYNPYNDSDNLMKGKTINEVKFIWVTQHIIFSDGTTLDS